MVKPVPPVTLTEAQRIQLNLAAKLPDGSTDPGPFSWTTDNPAFAEIVGDKLDANGEHVPDLDNPNPVEPTVWALTPATGAGSATIVAQSASPNVDGNSMVLNILEAVHGDVNLSAGTPVAD